MTEDEALKRRGGRPPGTGPGPTQLRHLRMGPLWEQGQTLAAAHGITMTALVEQALRREITRLERQAQREQAE